MRVEDETTKYDMEGMLSCGFCFKRKLIKQEKTKQTKMNKQTKTRKKNKKENISCNLAMRSLLKEEDKLICRGVHV